MRKFFPAAVFAFFALACMVSCNKDYTCTCTVVSKGVTHIITNDIGTTSKNDAKDKCNAVQTEYTDTVSGVSSTCHI